MGLSRQSFGRKVVADDAPTFLREVDSVVVR
jgi:hypothetical protein